MELSPIHTPAGFAPERLLPPLQAALNGEGPAVAPYLDPGTTFEPRLPNDEIAAVVCTSGSTGTPKQTMLSINALASSSAATAQRLGFEGQWLLALPVHYVAGLQVLVRSLYAGPPPVVDPSLYRTETGPDAGHGFTAQGFTEAAREMTDSRRLTSLVPTQLARLLDDPAAETLAALRRFDAILLGGAPASPRLLREARKHDLKIVTTYGSAETAGGCVYDGVPLPGVTVDIREGRVHLGGPTIADGYLGAPELTAQSFRSDGTTCWFRTSDLGSVDDDGVLRISGRADDVIITGGVKVSAAAVRESLEDIPGVRAAFVSGLEDAEWGQRVVAFVATLRPTCEIIEAASLSLRGALNPKLILTAPHLPLLANGKEDRLSMVKTLSMAAEATGHVPRP